MPDKYSRIVGKPRFVFVLTLAFLALAFNGPALAQEGGKEKPSPEPIELRPPSVTEHSIEIAGEQLDYTATVGYMVQKNEKGKPIGYFFYTAYVLKGQDTMSRPLSFCFNGGPGSSSIYLHMLTIGPKRAVLLEDGNTPGPPPRMVDNAHTWLTFSDLVFVDPIGTGFSFPHPGEDTKQFWGAEADAASVADFMRMYLTESKRWLSPIFVAGESYGGIRGALLAYELQNSRKINLNLNGIIFISPAFDFQDLATSKHIPLYLAHYLPAFATTAWFHNKLSEDLMADFDGLVAEATEWADTEFLCALVKGDRLTREEMEAIAARMSRYTGLSVDYIMAKKLRITSYEFREELLRDQEISLDRLDARFEEGAYELTTTLSPALNHYIRVDLGYDTLEPYKVYGRVRPWSWGDRPSPFSVVPSLRQAMMNNRSMKVFVAAGYYDYACPFSTINFALDQLLLKPELRENIVRRYYHTGHMVYTPTKELGEFTEDVRQFVEAATR